MLAPTFADRSIFSLRNRTPFITLQISRKKSNAITALESASLSADAMHRCPKVLKPAIIAIIRRSRNLSCKNITATMVVNSAAVKLSAVAVVISTFARAVNQSSEPEQ